MARIGETLNDVRIPEDLAADSGECVGHPAFAELERRIRSRDARVGVMGQGYVGFPLAQRIAHCGYHTIGYDISDAAVDRCEQQNHSRRYKAVHSAIELGHCDIVIIAVPTPTREKDVRVPDLSLVTTAVRTVLAHIPDDRRARLLVIESTYAPGTTRNVVAPLVNIWHRIGRNIALGYSPERIDPGNGRFTVENTPKITSGYDAISAHLTRLFYHSVVEKVVPASSLEAAEAAKILENTFRFVNITFCQEFDEYCQRLGVNSREVTELASTKPFGFMPFHAGAGIGGHCIAEDPYFLYESMVRTGGSAPILQAALANHEGRARVIVDRIAARLYPRSLVGSRILLLGVTYKPDVADPRRSPAAGILRQLEALGVEVAYHDPLIWQFEGHRSIDLASTSPEAYDLAVIVTRHSGLDLEAMRRAGWHVFDPVDPVRRDTPVSAGGGKATRDARESSTIQPKLVPGRVAAAGS